MADGVRAARRLMVRGAGLIQRPRRAAANPGPRAGRNRHHRRRVRYEPGTSDGCSRPRRWTCCRPTSRAAAGSPDCSTVGALCTAARAAVLGPLRSADPCPRRVRDRPVAPLRVLPYSRARRADPVRRRARAAGRPARDQTPTGRAGDRAQARRRRALPAMSPRPQRPSIWGCRTCCASTRCWPTASAASSSARAATTSGCAFRSGTPTRASPR